MRLRRSEAEALRASRAEISADDFLGTSKPRKKGIQSTGKTRLEELVEEAGRRARESDWEGARPTLLAALYVWCHRRVYKVDPALKGREFTAAGMRASHFVRDEFAGDLKAAVDFVRWTWSKEAGKEKRGRSDDFRVSWRYQFSGKLLVAYKVDAVRNGHVAKAAL